MGDAIERVNAIRDRWAGVRWRQAGHFLQGRAKEDIASLLAEVDRLWAQNDFLKRELLTADSTVTLPDGREFVVPRAVKTEIEALRARP